MFVGLKRHGRLAGCPPSKNDILPLSDIEQLLEHLHHRVGICPTYAGRGGFGSDHPLNVRCPLDHGGGSTCCAGRLTVPHRPSHSFELFRSNLSHSPRPMVLSTVRASLVRWGHQSHSFRCPPRCECRYPLRRTISSGVGACPFGGKKRPSCLDRC